MNNIYTLEPLNDSLVHYLHQTTGLEIIQLERGKFPFQSSQCDDISILICRDRDDISKILDVCSNIRMIFIVSTGVEKLPFDKLIQKNIVVCNTGGINSAIMSEYAMGAILLFSTRMRENIINQEKHFWKKFQCVDSLNGKRLVIVGAGRTGQLIAKKAKSFGMHLIGIKRRITSLDSFDEILSLDRIDETLSTADYIVCTIPSTPETVGLFNLNRFKKMNKYSLFINISRGNLVVQEDLVYALKQNLIGGAVLDVFDKEPLGCDNDLWNCPNLVITPHSSGRLENFMADAMKYAAKNINAFINGTQLPNKVDLIHGY